MKRLKIADVVKAETARRRSNGDPPRPPHSLRCSLVYECCERCAAVRLLQRWAVDAHACHPDLRQPLDGLALEVANMLGEVLAAADALGSADVDHEAPLRDLAKILKRLTPA
jgi:hypothetical protein